MSARTDHSATVLFNEDIISLTAHILYAGSREEARNEAAKCMIFGFKKAISKEDPDGILLVDKVKVLGDLIDGENAELASGKLGPILDILQRSSIVSPPVFSREWMQSLCELAKE